MTLAARTENRQPDGSHRAMGQRGPHRARIGRTRTARSGMPLIGERALPIADTQPKREKCEIRVEGETLPIHKGEKKNENVKERNQKNS